MDRDQYSETLIVSMYSEFKMRINAKNRKKKSFNNKPITNIQPIINDNASYNKFKLKNMDFKYKYSFFQTISMSILVLCLIFSVATVIANFFFHVPHMRFSFATIMDDPKPFFDLTEFPILKFPTKANLLVYNPNYYPVPIVSSVRAFVGNSNILFASGEVTGAILMPRKINRLEVNFMTTSNLFEPNLKLAAYTLDVCGLIQSHSKSVVNSRVHAYTKVGYFGIGIPMKDIYIPDITFLCPLIQQSLAEIILKVADDLLPYVEQLNGVWNDEEMKDRLEYYKF